jgi:septum formation protein
VWTGIAVATPSGAVKARLIETRLRFKRLSSAEVDAYVASDEWRGKAGGYAIQGIAGGFVVKLIGSYPAVVGLPLYETVGLLEGSGYPVRAGWTAPLVPVV